VRGITALGADHRDGVATRPRRAAGPAQRLGVRPMSDDIALLTRPARITLDSSGEDQDTPGRVVSDLDLVALTGGPVGPARQEILASLHRELDQGAAQGLDLGCVYVDAGRLADFRARHPTWTHGSLVQRSLSGVTRAELVRHGFAVLGRPPAVVLPEVTDDDVRRAARAELCGYWARAARRPLWWLEPGDRGPGADVDGTRPPRFADGRAVDQDTGDRAGACAGLAERPAPRPTAGPASGLAAGPDSADRVAGCSTYRNRRVPQGASLNSYASGQPGCPAKPGASPALASERR
jgi:hypothetical protein